jgi:hypothetical protein
MLLIGESDFDAVVFGKLLHKWMRRGFRELGDKGG